MTAAPVSPPQAQPATGRLRRRFEAIVFDWDGTAVPDRASDAARLRELVEAACAWGLHLAIVTGTNVANVDGQLAARPSGPGTLHLLVSRGAEVHRVGRSGPRMIERRSVSALELERLATAAESTVGELRRLGLADAVVLRRPSRVKIDLIPAPEWSDPPKARIAELVAAVEGRLADHGIRGLRAVVELARCAALAAGVADPRVTTDAKHVELGLTDKSDAAGWIFGRLWRLGVAPSLVLVAGDEFGPMGDAAGSDSLMLAGAGRTATAVTVGAEPGGAPPGVLAAPGGPVAFLRLLEDQVERRRAGEAPRVAEDPRWSIVVDGSAPAAERAHESRLTLADGCIGTRGSVVVPVPGASPAVFVAGVYQGEGAASELLRGPLWNQLDLALPPGRTVRRVLDLRAGLLCQELSDAGERLEAVLLCSAARPGTAVVRASGTPGGAVEWGPPLIGPGVQSSPAGEARVRLRGDRGGVAVAASQQETGDASARRLDRVATFRAHPRRCPTLAATTAALRRAEAAGFERLLNEHRAAMAERWEHAAIAIRGDPELERAVRFCLFHLLGSVPGGGEAAVGARGLTGPAYRGHVFWDADVFVMPFLAATRPQAARAMLEYRIRRLPAARAAAASEGTAGAHLAWESAATGDEVAPSRGRDRRGRVIAIQTGRLEEHIVADVAWAACCYAAWSGDTAFLAGPGRGLLLETARWWAARIELDAGGSAHIRGIVGPDEDHFPVDDDAFTNVMARWNLRRAAALADTLADAGVSAAERKRWRTLADALVDGYDPATGIYEQFAGFHALEPLLIADLAPRRPIAAPLLLGFERVAQAQVVKQADVLMLHHLVPGEVAPGSLVPNLDHYEPRTSHGSSLSPGVHASLLARAGRVELARDLLALTASIDLHDVTGNTGGGLHLAAMGSVWQALAWGFAGLRPEGDVLRIAPNLPDRWDALELRIRFRGVQLRLVLRHDAVEIDAGRPLQVRIQPGAPRRLGAGRHLIPSARSHS